jgi:hypothetical protein
VHALLAVVRVGGGSIAGSCPSCSAVLPGTGPRGSGPRPGV